MELLKKQDLQEILLNEHIQLAVAYSLAFLIPFCLKQPHILIGSLINLLLIFSITKFDFKKTFPIVLIPSLAVALNGVLFGTFTIYLVYMIPFITIANLIYALSFKYLKMRYLRIVISALLKASFLFSTAYILVNTIQIPEIFLTTMGLIQLFTALIGGTFTEILLHTKKST